MPVLLKLDYSLKLHSKEVLNTKLYENIHEGDKVQERNNRGGN